MKDYIIWLKSGESICGEAEDHKLQELQAKWLEHEGEEKEYGF